MPSLPTSPTVPPPSRREALAWLAGLAMAAAGTAHAEADGPGGFDRGLLWRVERRGVAPSHLFGTLHLDDPRALDFRPPVRRAFAAARVLVIEMLEDDTSARRFVLASRLEGGATLRDIAGEEIAARVAAVLGSSYGMPPEVSLQLKPWAAYLVLAQPTRPLGEIVDAALRRMARQRALPVQALETLDEQVQALEAVPEASQVALLDAIARRHDEAQAAIPALLERYLVGDLAGLLSLQSSTASRRCTRRSTTCWSSCCGAATSAWRSACSPRCARAAPSPPWARCTCREPRACRHGCSAPAGGCGRSKPECRTPVRNRAPRAPRGRIRPTARRSRAATALAPCADAPDRAASRNHVATLHAWLRRTPCSRCSRRWQRSASASSCVTIT